MYVVSIICTMIVVIAILAVFMREENLQMGAGAQNQKLLDNQEKLYMVLVIIGIILLIITRVYKLGTVPDGVNQDEAMAAVDAYALSEYGTDRFGMSYPVHFTAWGYGQMSVLLSYLMIPFIKLGGLNILSVRLPMMLISLFGGFTLFLLISKAVGKRAGLIILYLTVMNPWHFMQSRWSLDCNVFPHMFIIGMYFLYKGFRRKRYIYISMFFFAMSMYCYGVSFYVVPFFLLFACVIMNKMKLINLSQSFLSAGIYFLFAWPIYLTMLINAMGWDTIHFFGITLPYFPGSVRSGDILFFSEEPGKQFLRNLYSLLRIVFIQERDSIWNALDNFGTIYWCTMPFVFVGLIYVIQIICREKDKEKKMAFALLLIYWFCGLLAGLLIANVNVNRINIIFYAQIILAALGIEYIVKKSNRVLPVICGVYLCMSIVFTVQYYRVYAEDIRDYFFADFLEAIEEAQKLNSDCYYIALATQYDEAANCSEILTLYEQKIDALYFQGKTNLFMGKEIAYDERYHYNIPEDDEINCDEDIVYVLRSEQRGRFSEDEFEVREFGEFILVRSR